MQPSRLYITPTDVIRLDETPQICKRNTYLAYFVSVSATL